MALPWCCTYVCVYVHRCAHTPFMQKHFPSLQSYSRRRRQVYVLALENMLNVEVYIKNKVYRIQ